MVLTDWDVSEISKALDKLEQAIRRADDWQPGDEDYARHMAVSLGDLQGTAISTLITLRVFLEMAQEGNAKAPAGTGACVVG